MKKKSGMIYSAISPSGKIYIGQTVASLAKRKCKHRIDAKTHTYAFANAIRKYGIDNFVWEILEDSIPSHKLNGLEKHYIKKFDSYRHGYNSTEGGENNPMSYKSVRIKVSKATKGRKKKTVQYGEKNPAAKLKQTDITKIRQTYCTKKYSQREIAESFSVSRSLIKAIVKNKIWFDPNYIPICFDKKNKLTDKITSEIINKFKTGEYTTTSLAKKYNLSHSTISLVLKNANNKAVKNILKSNCSKRKLSDDKIKCIIKERNNGMLIKSLAKKYKISKQTVYRYLSAYKLPR